MSESEAKNDALQDEVKSRVEEFQKEYQALCTKFRCNHRPIINASQAGIVPSFVIVVSNAEEPKDELGEGLVEPEAKEPEEAK